jgi:hypothetical protein
MFMVIPRSSYPNENSFFYGAAVSLVQKRGMGVKCVSDLYIAIA